MKWFFDNLEDNRSYNHETLVEHFGGLAAWLWINTLCEADILEYGRSPMYGWLTEKGERLRDYLKDKSVDEIIEIYNTVEVKCGLDYCNCDEGKYIGNSEPCRYNKLFNK